MVQTKAGILYFSALGSGMTGLLNRYIAVEFLLFGSGNGTDKFSLIGGQLTCPILAFNPIDKVSVFRNDHTRIFSRRGFRLIRFDTLSLFVDNVAPFPPKIQIEHFYPATGYRSYPNHCGQSNRQRQRAKATTVSRQTVPDFLHDCQNRIEKLGFNTLTLAEATAQTADMHKWGTLPPTTITHYRLRNRKSQINLPNFSLWGIRQECLIDTILSAKTNGVYVPPLEAKFASS